ncbi:hypothetical protein GE09DRAFT_395626 [Coniochaeta sp. 2T2.1]|nr:hypothetical protein GE09DRAFT_395626 [Coniochaeta sp. 2T2.1]
MTSRGKQGKHNPQRSDHERKRVQSKHPAEEGEDSGSTSQEPLATVSTQNEPSTPISFWKETDARYGYLCQWYHCPFKDDGKSKTYKSAEHYLMHHKALVFGDEDIALQILKAGTPRKAKGLGRQVANFDENVWNEQRERIVREGNYFKFTNAVSEEGLRLGDNNSAPLVGMSLRELLLSTGERELVEASRFDPIWGIGFSAADAETTDRSLWGLNLLGKALMEVRKRLKEEDDEKEKGKEKHKQEATTTEGPIQG